MTKRYYDHTLHDEQRRRHDETGGVERWQLPLDPSVKLINVYVEGYEDVAFWRGIFDHFERPDLTFHIDVPPREDLAKGKKVLLGMVKDCADSTILCMDSDFDYLFGGENEQSKMVNDAPCLFHTYAYATENYLCYGPSLHNICVKATKNDMRIFDFDRFLKEYSRIIYPLFLWYAYSAKATVPKVFTLIDFKSSVKLNYLEVEDNGLETLSWLRRQVDKRLATLHNHHPHWDRHLERFSRQIRARGVTEENTYLFMQGHTLMDNVVGVMLHAVCEKLKYLANEKISAARRSGLVLHNEQSNYNNSLRNVRDILLDNENYKDCFLYRKLRGDIERHIAGLNGRPAPPETHRVF